jgi:hydrogenase nickel incorporation protein HypB
LPYLGDFSPEKAEQCLRALASKTPVMRVSARSGDGLETWLGWLEGEVAQHKARLKRSQTLRPQIQQDGRRLHGTAPAIRFRPVAKT